jgi:hypothetical protein
MITSGQREQTVQVVASAARKGGEEAANEVIDELVSSGDLNSTNLQRVLAQGDKLAANVAARAKAVVKKTINDILAGIVGCLKLISSGEAISIGATDGTETPSESSDVFDGYIDGDFKNWGLDVPSAPSPKVAVEVYEMIEDADFKKMFGGFGENLDRLRFSWPQVKSFAKTNRKWLRTEGYATFIPFTKAGESVNEDKSNLFVAYVSVYDGRLKVYVDQFSFAYVWYGENRRRVVVPQL